MDININLNNDFVEIYNRLHTEYGEKLAKLNGFSDKQLNYTEFIDNFIDKETVADASIDGNANVGNKDIVTLMNEMAKPHQKLLAANKIYHELCKAYDKKTADKWFEAEYKGYLYLHDFSTSSFVSYCFAFDLKDLAEKGLFFIDNFNAEPPKHLITFVDFVKEFISYNCQRSSGAVGLPNLIPYLYYFWDRDIKNGYWNDLPEKYAKQNIQRLIYALNQPFLRGTQSAFTNTSIFDHPYLEALFGGATFPDGSFMIDEIEEIMEFQKMFLEEMSRIRSKNMMTFPVNSISLLYQNGKFVDEEFARWACAHNMKWSDSNFFIDDSVTSLSNCCFDGSQVCIVRKFNMRCYLSFEQLYNTVGEDKTIEIFHKGDWKNGKVVRLPGRKMYKIETISNRIITVTDNHLNPTIDGDKPTTALTTDDYLLCDFLDMSGLQYDKIKSIEEIPEIPEYVYCFEMENQEEPYFTLANGIITHNCRLKSDINELGYFNSVGGTALKVGSVKVNTVNLARLALENDTEDKYIESLKKVLNLTLKSLDCVRHIIKRNVDKGLLKNFSLGIVDFEHLYNTVGVIGIYEAIKKFGYTKTDALGNTYYTDEAFAFGKKIFDTIHAVNADFAKDKDYKINVEQIPGETAASKLMQKDLIFHPDTTVTDLPLYGNQFIPLGITTTLQERMRIASAFDSFCNGGSIWHCNIEAPFNNFEQAWKMLNYVAEQGITYFAFNTKIQACKHNHGFYGKTCPECGEPVETEYSRIVGFYVPIKTYSKERKAEYSMRKWMDVNNVD
nr:MAG TPA: anaerobic ribonucleoside triphosphate reductase [Caudoviricetes sp.]